MTEQKRDQAGEDKASKDAKPGELSVEELAKVSGGRVISGLSGPMGSTSIHGFKAPLGNTFTKG